MAQFCPPIPLCSNLDLQEFASWKENLLSYMKEIESMKHFLPGGLYSTWLPMQQSLDDARIVRPNINDPMANFTLNKILKTRNQQLCSTLEWLASLGGNNEALVNTCDASTNINTIMDYLQETHCRDKKPTNVLQLRSCTFDEDREDFCGFYKRFRLKICENLKKRGHLVRASSDEEMDYYLEEDEIISPTFEDVIVLWCLEKIDPSLPNVVADNFGVKLLSGSSLKELQREIFEYIPCLLEELHFNQKDAAYKENLLEPAVNIKTMPQEFVDDKSELRSWANNHQTFVKWVGGEEEQEGDRRVTGIKQMIESDDEASYDVDDTDYIPNEQPHASDYLIDEPRVRTKRSKKKIEEEEDCSPFEQWKCTVCKLFFNKRDKLMNHIREKEHNAFPVKVNLAETLKKETLKALEEGIVLEQLLNTKNEELENVFYSKDDMWTCELCHMTFFFRDKAVTHCDSVCHSDQPVKKSYRKRCKMWKCSYCDSRFKTQERLDVHNQNDHNIITNKDRVINREDSNDESGSELRQTEVEKMDTSAKPSKTSADNIVINIQPLEEGQDSVIFTIPGQEGAGPLSKEDLSNLTTPIPAEDWVICPLCPLILPSEDMPDHLKRHDEDQDYENGAKKCRKCGKHFDDGKELINHVTELQHYVEDYVDLGVGHVNAHLHYSCPLCTDKTVGKHMPKHIAAHAAEEGNWQNNWTCHKCEDVFHHRLELMDHIQNADDETHQGCKVHVRDDLSCSECGLAYFHSERELRFHIFNNHKVVDNNHTENKIYDIGRKCYMCDIVFESSKVLLEHLKTTEHKSLPEGRDPARQSDTACPICGQVWSSENKMLYHMKSHKKRETGLSNLKKQILNPYLTCDKCGETFLRTKLLNRHKRVVCPMDPDVKKRKKAMPRQMCPNCGKQYKSMPVLRKHLKLVCSRDKPLPPLPKPNKVAKPKPAKKVGTKKEAQEKRTKSKEENSQICENCGKQYKRLVDHIRSGCGNPDLRAVRKQQQASLKSEVDEADLPPSQKKFPCTQCGKMLRQNEFEKHAQRHEENKVCMKCGKTFMTESSRHEHETRDCMTHRPSRSGVKNVKRDRNIRCNFCKRCFFTEEYKAKHLCKPNICDICGKQFLESRFLRYHKKGHEGVTLFPCDVEGCEAVFLTRKLMLSHRRRQLDPEKKIECKVCGKKVYTNGDLNKHFKKYHTKEGMNVTCPLCNKVMHKYHLQLHMRTVHNENRETFPCSGACGMVTTFKWKSELKNHMELSKCHPPNIQKHFDEQGQPIKKEIHMQEEPQPIQLHRSQHQQQEEQERSTQERHQFPEGEYIFEMGNVVENVIIENIVTTS